MADTIVLLIDVVCSDCGKLIALSRSYSCEYRYLCPACAEETIKEIDKQYGLEFDNGNDS